MKREGNYGKSFNDRVLAGDVRTLTLQECKFWLSNRKSKMYKLVLANLSRSVLPKLNVHSGDEDGGPLVVEISGVLANKHAIKSSSRTNSG